MSNIQITSPEKISEDTIRVIYEIHSNSLPNDVMPNFGLGVERKYLLELIDKQNGRILIATDSGKIIGFLLLRFKPINMKGLLDGAAFIEFILNSLRKKVILIQLIFQLFWSRSNPEGSCEIDYFAVLEQHRSKGVGAKLLLMAEEVSIKNGFESIYTKTNNKALYSFYKKMKGAIVVYSFSILSDKYYGVLWSAKKYK
jgi:ribosomal protein S18 acetylase RimI-like enzyme